MAKKKSTKATRQRSTKSPATAVATSPGPTAFSEWAPRLVLTLLERQRNALVQDFEDLKRWWPTLEDNPQAAKKLRSRLLTFSSKGNTSLNTVAGRQKAILEFCSTLGAEAEPVNRLFQRFMSGNVCDPDGTKDDYDSALVQLNDAINRVESIKRERVIRRVTLHNNSSSMTYKPENRTAGRNDEPTEADLLIGRTVFDEMGLKSVAVEAFRKKYRAKGGKGSNAKLSNVLSRVKFEKNITNAPSPPSQPGRMDFDHT